MHRAAATASAGLFSRSFHLSNTVYKIFQYAFGISILSDSNFEGSATATKTNYHSLLNGIFDSFSTLDPTPRSVWGDLTPKNPSTPATHMSSSTPTMIPYDLQTQSGAGTPFDFGGGPSTEPSPASNYDFQHVSLAFTIAIVGTFVFMYFVMAFTRWIFGCSGFWKRPSLAECVRRMDQYYEVMDPKHFDSLTIHSTDKEGTRELFEPVVANTESGDVSIDMSNSAVMIGDRTYDDGGDDDEDHPPPKGYFKKFTNRLTHRNRGDSGKSSTTNRNQKQRQPTPFYEFYTNNKGDENILDFIRGDFVMLLVTMMQIALILGILTFTFWALGTDLMSVSAYLGIAWTALWFQSGIATMFGSFFSYIAVLLSNKYRLGSLVYIPGQMAEKVGCVVDITPLRLCLVVKSSGTMDSDSTQLLRLDVPISTVLQVPTYEVLKVKHTQKKQTPTTGASTAPSSSPSSSTPFANPAQFRPANADPSSSSSVFVDPQQQQQHQQQFQQTFPYALPRQ